MLISDSSASKTARFVFGVFLLCAITVPVAGAVEAFGEINIGEVPEYSESEDMLLLQKQAAEERLTELAQSKLAGAGFENIPCRVSLVCEDEQISSLRCYVSLEGIDADKRLAVEELLRTELGMEMELYPGNY